ncbi:PE family protein [Mycobacterium sp.]|uniref:PE family protein n=1 Tax=Mycobacterium sp. TaxID=1785 RepID=UPI0025FDD0AA|nr:PE family protein [Mycobacterium sp.]MBW0013349.1 PE family protein [Mycobacterium sp.]
MSFLFAAPEALAAAASDLAGIGSTLGTASADAAAPTSGVMASAADEVSAQVAALLSEHGLGYQQLSKQMAQFHEQFVQTLSAGAGAYAAAEASAAQTLSNTVKAPAASLSGNAVGAAAAGGGGAVGGAVSNAVGRMESAVAGPSLAGGARLLGGGGSQGIASEIGTLLRPTGGISALTSASALLNPAAVTNAAPGAVAAASLGDAIKAGYLRLQPWVQYGVNLAAYGASFVPYVGYVAQQFNIVYYLFQPIVQASLFNLIDVLQGTITFSQGLNNVSVATAASINQFIYNETNWLFGTILPPLPPIPPF